MAMMNAEKDILAAGLSALSRRDGAPGGLNDSAYQDLLMELMALVLERNKSVNLTAITEPEDFVRLHLIDSLSCVGLKELAKAKTIADVGSGAGFPGLPLAALYPDKQFLLTDSLRKRIEFAGFTAKALGIENARVLHIRAENAGRDPILREGFDLALCRAVGKMSLVLEYCLPLVRVGGAAVFYKTASAEKEIEESLRARKTLGGSASVRIETNRDILPDRDHVLYVITKDRPTPKEYPRREGVPAKAPL